MTNTYSIAETNKQIQVGMMVANHLVHEGLLPPKAFIGVTIKDGKPQLRLATNEFHESLFHDIVSEACASGKYKRGKPVQKITILSTENINFYMVDLEGDSLINAKEKTTELYCKSEELNTLISRADLFIKDLFTTSIMTTDLRLKTLTEWSDEYVDAMKYLGQVGLGGKFDYLSTHQASRILTSMRKILNDIRVTPYSENVYRSFISERGYRILVSVIEKNYLKIDQCKDVKFLQEWSETNGFYFDANGNPL